MHPYGYPPLHDAEFQTRILTLQPAESLQADIHLDLREMSLRDNGGREIEIPSYEALSYAWGTRVGPVTVYIGPTSDDALNSEVEDLNQEHVELHGLEVTQNLAQALRYLRYKDRPRVLWVDAICIDQQNIEERCLQVQQMAEIYYRASDVLIWVGNASTDSELAMHTLRDVGSKVEVDYRGLGRKLIIDEPQDRWLLDNDAPPPWSAKEVMALCSFCDRDWFWRLWVRQEVCFRFQATIVCDYECLPWKVFRRAVFCFSHRSWTGRRSYVFANCYMLCDMDPSGSRNILDLSLQTIECKVTDPRDRIYALLNVTAEEVPLKMTPDYSKTVEEVYQDLVVGLVNLWDNLEYMILCADTGGSLNLPTWVPDFSALPGNAALRTRSLSQRAAPSVRHFTQKTLEVAGSPVRRIQGVYYFRDRGRKEETYWRLGELCDMIQTADRDLRLSEKFSVPAGGFQQYIICLCRVLYCGNFFHPDIPSSVGRASFQSGVKLLNQLLGEGVSVEALERDNDLCCSFLRVSLPDTALCTTLGSQMALTHKSVRPGDEIVQLLGCNLPMILRPVGDETFRVVSACYLDEHMALEAFLGPLPHGWQIVPRSTSGGILQTLWHPETGRTQAADPRLGALPAGWRLREHKLDEVYELFGNDDLGVDFTRNDPRLSVEALKERGVEIRDFVLV